MNLDRNLDRNLDLNIDPVLWGPSFWRSLHYITFGYPENPTETDKTNAYNLFVSLQYVLPCEKCRVNFGQQLINSPLTTDVLSSKNKLITWLINIHNEVNRSLGKPILSEEGALKLYLTETNKSIFSKFIDLFESIRTYDFRILTIIITVILIIILLIIIRFRVLNN